MARWKIGLSQLSRWAGAAQAGERSCRVTFLPFPAASPQRLAWPRTCIAELFVEPVLQMQLGRPRFDGFLGGEKENSSGRGREQDVSEVWVAETAFTGWQQLD